MSLLSIEQNSKSVSTNKDWTGNSVAMYSILGASNHSVDERVESDFYATDPRALLLFLEKIHQDGIQLNSNIWECACGQRSFI